MKPQFQYYNAYEEFTKKDEVYHINEIKQFVRDCVQYIFSVKKFTWKYSRTIRDKHGHELKTSYRIISRDPPFRGSDDFRINMVPSKEQLDEQLKKLTPEKIDHSEKELM